MVPNGIDRGSGLTLDNTSWELDFVDMFSWSEQLLLSLEEGTFNGGTSAINEYM